MDQTQAIVSAIDGYFDLMYCSDDRKFPEVFHDVCLIHGMRDGTLTAWSASEFRDVMRNRPSPASTEAPREQEIISLEHAASELAVARVRVRIGETRFVDHLVFHRIDKKWLVTSKAFHIERTFPPGS